MIKKNIATNELGFVFNPATGDSFSTNPIAASIIQMMKEQKSLKEIKNLLADSYDAESSVIEKDLDDFISTLRDNHLLAS
jgi:hypothetical protein